MMAHLCKLIDAKLRENIKNGAFFVFNPNQNFEHFHRFSNDV